MQLDLKLTVEPGSRGIPPGTAADPPKPPKGAKGDAYAMCVRKFDIIYSKTVRKEEDMAEMIKRFFVSMRCAVPRNVFDMTAGTDRSDEVLVYADGVPPQQADAEAIYSDWCAVGNSLLDATMRIPA